MCVYMHLHVCIFLCVCVAVNLDPSGIKARVTTSWCCHWWWEELRASLLSLVSTVSTPVSQKIFVHAEYIVFVVLVNTSLWVYYLTTENNRPGIGCWLWQECVSVRHECWPKCSCVYWCSYQTCPLADSKQRMYSTIYSTHFFIVWGVCLQWEGLFAIHTTTPSLLFHVQGHVSPALSLGAYNLFLTSSISDGMKLWDLRTAR